MWTSLLEAAEQRGRLRPRMRRCRRTEARKPESTTGADTALTRTSGSLTWYAYGSVEARIPTQTHRHHKCPDARSNSLHSFDRDTTPNSVATLLCEPSAALQVVETDLQAVAAGPIDGEDGAQVEPERGGVVGRRERLGRRPLRVPAEWPGGDLLRGEGLLRGAALQPRERVGLLGLDRTRG